MSKHLAVKEKTKRDIRTTYERKPLKSRGFDWTAVDYATYDGDGSPIGYGSNEAEAIEDLQLQLELEDA